MIRQTPWDALTDDQADQVRAAAQLADYPHLRRLSVDHVLQPGYDFTDEFDFGLDLILDGLAGVADRTSGG